MHPFALLSRKGQSLGLLQVYIQMSQSPENEKKLSLLMTCHSSRVSASRTSTQTGSNCLERDRQKAGPQTMLPSLT